MTLDYWTLAFQMINFLVLIALLRWLFYRPVLAIIDARRQAIEMELADAAAARKQTEAEQQRLTEQLASQNAASEHVLQVARESAELERQNSLQQASKDAADTIASARVRIMREQQEAARAVFDEASILATSLARRLLAMVPTIDNDVAFVDDLLTQVAATPAEQRATWFAAHTERQVTVTSARDLNPGEQNRVAEQLRRVLGDQLDVQFEVSELLLTGAELTFSHGVLALNWAAELARARAQMRDAAQAVA